MELTQNLLNYINNRVKKLTEEYNELENEKISKIKIPTFERLFEITHTQSEIKNRINELRTTADYIIELHQLDYIKGVK